MARFSSLSEMSFPEEPCKVVLTEYERGWGSKEFHVVYFDNYAEGVAYAAEVNAENTENFAPDYYITATFSKIF